MAIIARDNRTPYDPAPEGLQQGVCVDVVDKGLMETPWGKQEKVDIFWQVDSVNEKTNKRFVVMKRYTLSLNEKSNLFRDLTAWRGRAFTKEELDGFDLEKLVGANCQIQVQHQPSDKGGVWANVQAIVPLGKGQTKLAPLDYERHKDRTEKTGEAPVDAANDDVPF